jgi:outer membrane protein assembly factor BamE
MMLRLKFETKTMRIGIILLALLLTSCGLKPYKMDIHQGNFITAEMRAKLKLGMSKTQVRYVLGTPMVNDPFHDNRWDYVYRLEHGGKVTEQQRLTLNFSGSSLQSIDDGTQIIQADPADKKAAASVPTVAPTVLPQAIAAPLVVTPPLNDASLDVMGAVQAWAEAWSSQETEQYFASYADTFRPASMSKAAWQTQRKQRIGKPGVIEVTLKEINVEMRDDSHASATFEQSYRADTYQDTTRKTLRLEKVDGAWLIVSEQVVK